jgi:hypothetical protein
MFLQPNPCLTNPNWPAVALALVTLLAAIITPIVTSYLNRVHTDAVTKQQTSDVAESAEERARIVAKKQTEEILPVLETIHNATNGGLVALRDQVAGLVAEIKRLKGERRRGRK